MRTSLQERLEKQIRNEAALRKGHRLEYEQVMKLGAMIYVDEGREVDVARLKECKRILKDKTGILSNFRGAFQYIVQIKMALSEDPAAYLDGVLRVYARLKEKFRIPGESVAMAATTIYENCPADRLDEVIDKTLMAYTNVKNQHRFITGESDLAMISLMIMAGIDPDQAANRAEELYVTLKEYFPFGADTPQAAAMILSLSDKPAAQKVQDFMSLYEACKAAGHATSRDKTMAIYACFADLDADHAAIVAEIDEVDSWLKGNKGYGTLGIGSSLRRFFAAAHVLEDLQRADTEVQVGTTSAVAQSIVVELVIVLISIIVTSIVISSTVSTANN